MTQGSVTSLSGIKRTTGKPVVYFVKRSNDGLVKVGYTANLKQRLHRLRCDTGCETRLIGTISGGSRALERAAHRHLAADRVTGEWFKDSDALRALASGAETVEVPDAFAGVAGSRAGAITFLTGDRGGGPSRDPVMELRRNIVHCLDAGLTADAAASVLDIRPERLKREVKLMRALGLLT